jgi:Mn-dependent DtxR family transcriptional regulator
MLKSELRRAEFLSALYEMSGGNPQQSVETKFLGKKINMEEPEISQVGVYLKEEGLIDFFTFGNISITHKGRKMVEANMAESYAQKERRVLEAMKDMSRMSRIILFPELAKRLEMSERELAVICNGLHDEDSINFPDGDFVEMKAGGYRRLEPSENQPSTGPTINIGQNYGAAAIGTHINQVVNITHSEEFTQAINNLVQLVQSSPLDSSDKDEATEEIVRINNLAAREPNNGRLDKIKSTIKSLEVVLASAQLLEKAKPFLDGVWNYIKTKYHLPK